MRRLLATGFLAVAALSSAPASAAPGGDCDGKVDVVCNETPCRWGDPCTITPCVVWSASKCLT